MKKNDFDNRLQNDLFPKMPISFGRKLTKAMEDEGVKVKKRSTATGVFTGAVSLVAAAAVLLIVLMGVLSRGTSDPIQAAAPGLASTSAATETPQSTPAVTAAPMTWPWSPKVFTLSTGFEFKNEEKLEALYTNILYSLMRRGESEPDELWLCAIKSRYVQEDTGDRADGYLSGYYVLAQHAFGVNDGPELYCLSDDFEVLWCTEGSAPGPNHAVNPEGDNYAGTYQGHFVYGMAPTDAHVTRGALVGSEPGTDVEFSMAASIAQVQERLSGSAHLDAAREYFLISVSAHDWDSVMENPVLRFETLEGPVDVDMKNDLPKAMVALGDRFTLDPVPTTDPNLTPTSAPDEEPADPTPTADPNQVQGVEYWLSQNQSLMRDFTDDWDGAETAQQYAEAVRRALLTSGEHIQNELWLCGVTRNWDDGKQDGTYILALNVGDGEPSPELFYYKDGRILWRTAGADTERVNVVYHNGNTLVFGRSPAFDGEPLPMSYGKIVLADGGSDQVSPVLALSEIRERIPEGHHYYDSARECFLWTDGAVNEVSRVTIAARIDGKDREFTLNKVNVLEPQNVPAMAVESGGVVYPGTVTRLAYALNENGINADGYPLSEILANGLLFKGQKRWTRPLTVLTASENVTVKRVNVYRVTAGDNAQGAAETLERVAANQPLSAIDDLPAGEYYLCFETYVQGPYVEKIGKYTYRMDYTIYKVTLE